MTQSSSIVPKFYKSVIDDVLHNVREIFLDDGVDEQVIQELRAVWERKISESRAVEPATNSNDSSSNSTTNSQSNKSSNKSQAGGQTSVITSNPNHVKNGPKSANNNNNNNNNNSGISSTTTIATTTTSINRVKEEIIEEELSIHRQSANRKASSKSQPMLPTVVPTPPPMISNGGLVHTMPGAANLAQAPAPTNHLIRASAIVTNPLGPTGMTTIPSTAPQLIQVLQSNHGNKNDGAPPITHATTATPLQRSAAVMKSQNILNIIPSSSSSFSSVGSSTNHFSHSAIVTNAKDNCGGDIGSSFSTPNVAMTESIVSSNNVATKRINTMPLGHKKRILSYAIAESNSGLNGGSASGSGNLFSIADLAASQPSSSVHNASSSSMQSHLLNLERQQNANRPTSDRVHAMGTQFAHLDAAPGPPSSHGLVTSAAHGGLQSMANQQNSQIIMGTRAVTSGANSKQEVKYPSISVGPAGHKVVLLPNNPNSYVMPNAPFVITPDILSQLQLQGGIITTGPGGHQTVLHHAPTALGASTIQYATTATRGMTPTIQQLRTVSGLMPTLGPAQVGQPGASNSNNPGARVAQFDGLGDSSDDDDDEDDYRDNDDDQDDNDDEINDEENEGGIEDEEPLNSGDDVSDEDPNELFETDNVVVCQYDKITRSRNKWKFHFKDGIMNLQGKDYVFQKAVGDAEW